MQAVPSRIVRSVTRRRVLAAAIDLALVVLAYYVVLGFRYQGDIPERIGLGSRELPIFLAVAVAVHLTANTLFSVYNIVNRYVGLPQANWVVKACASSVVVLLLVDAVWSWDHIRIIPLSVVVVGGFGACVAMLAVRFYSRLLQTRSLTPLREGKRILLVGAGSAAETLLRQIDHNPTLGLKVVGLLDDDPRLRGMYLRRYPVLGSVAEAAEVAAAHEVEEFVITIPSADAGAMERVYSQVSPAGLPVKTLPPLSDLIGGRVTFADVRDLTIEDLLGRSPVETDLRAIGGYLKDRRVLVTGAAGSIGSELCRQIAEFDPKWLILVDRDESGLYALHEELRRRGFHRYDMVTTNIQQRGKMRLIMSERRPQVVFHAAAFKHVPLMESCPDEAVLNNVMGTLVVAQAAAAAKVERFVNISTDKAADPSSVMGASKRLAELVVRHVGEEHPGTRFCSVRFGNVLGSQGSMLPIFKKQIEAGGPVTVTHKDMQRYFMSISEAVQLVMQAAAMVAEAEEGGIFVLQMGQPVRILDLAKKMIAFATHGRGGISIEFTGLRPGERLEEALVGEQERALATAHPMISLVFPSTETAGLPWDFEAKFERLIGLARAHGERETLVVALQSLLPNYTPFELDQVLSFPLWERAEGKLAEEREGADLGQAPMVVAQGTASA